MLVDIENMFSMLDKYSDTRKISRKYLHQATCFLSGEIKVLGTKETSDSFLELRLN